jgi:hypothetical protein
LVLFGSADGRVYCLRGQDGGLVWRYLAAAEDRQIVSYQQPESVWPVHGSVLVYGEAVYGLAGRNMFFDGGMRLVRLDPRTGKKISETVLNELDPGSGKNLQTLIAAKTMPVANPDILSCDGTRVYMQTQQFDLEGKRTRIAPFPPQRADTPEGRHLFCPTGFLDDLWYHRTYMIYGSTCGEGWADYNLAQKQTPCGRIMALDGLRAYAFRADNLGNTLFPTPTYRLYAADTTIKNEVKTAAAEEKPAGKAGKGKKQGKVATDDNIAGGYKVYWQIQSPPLLVNAMAVAAKTLLVAGPPDVADESQMLGFLPGADDEINRQLQAQDDAWRGKAGALLWVVSKENGSRLAEYRLPSPPTWDGMAVAQGKLFLSLQNGAVACWAQRPVGSGQ